MINRHLQPSANHSFFLFGARGTGKSTFLRKSFADRDVLWLDLLLPEVEDRYASNPNLLAEQIAARPDPSDWVVIDEVQKVPKLLNVVHSQIELSGTRFALTGSSARKLKRGAVNLLAGRAFVYHMFPFTTIELDAEFDLDNALAFGTLPGLFELSSPVDKADFLRAYALTYLKEEVWGEQLVRNLDPFRAFIEIAAQCNGELINYSRIGRDTGVDTKTVQSYFQILEDTLVAYMLEPYHRSVRKRQRQAPRFYLFDTGVCRALSRTLNIPLNPGTYAYGRAFEHFVVTEALRRNDYLKTDFKFSYLRTKDGAEVDLVVERPGQSTVLIEIKSSAKIDPTDIRHLKRFVCDIPDSRAICLSQEPLPRIVDGIHILPWENGLSEIGLSGLHPSPAAT
jgi:predicted AAA+ superfamily ATPase